MGPKIRLITASSEVNRIEGGWHIDTKRAGMSFRHSRPEDYVVSIGIV